MTRLGVIGKPSDWLISSDVDYKKAKEIFGIELIDIDISELIDGINSNTCASFPNKFQNLFDKAEIDKAYLIFKELIKIKDNYMLDGLTVRCFDLLDTVHSTSCLAFSILNSNGITATCEGDIPSMISMDLIRKVINKESFQANPSRIYTDKNEIVFAHCTLPLSMSESYKFDTHFESGIGIGIKGEMFLKDVIIFRISPTLDKFVLLRGHIKENLHEKRLCRTQIVVDIDKEHSVEYFLKRPLGNHHLIVYTDNNDANVLRDYLINVGLTEIK